MRCSSDRPAALLFPGWSMGGVLNTPERREAFLRHGIDGAAGLAKLTPEAVLSLALTLSRPAEAHAEAG